MDLLAMDFLTLFDGRREGYGAWEGGKVECPSDDAWWVDAVSLHLRGDNGIGVYPARLDGTCRWGCVDVDKTDDPAIVLNLQNALNVKGVVSWTERTRNGYHLWVFSKDWTPLATMRNALRAACAAVSYDPKEVNPKQTELGDGKWGNYVRLPYMGGDVATARYIFSSAVRLPLAAFVDAALAYRNEPSLLEQIAALAPPEREMRRYEFGPAEEVDATLTRRMSGLSSKVWREGPLEGSDRSSTMAHLAFLLREEGFTPQEGYAILRSAGWQKFRGREDEDQRLTELVGRVWR